MGSTFTRTNAIKHHYSSPYASLQRNELDSISSSRQLVWSGQDSMEVCDVDEDDRNVNACFQGELQWDEAGTLQIKWVTVLGTMSTDTIWGPVPVPTATSTFMAFYNGGQGACALFDACLRLVTLENNTEVPLRRINTRTTAVMYIVEPMPNVTALASTSLCHVLVQPAARFLRFRHWPASIAIKRECSKKQQMSVPHVGWPRTRW
jgi:hypothetical protein